MSALLMLAAALLLVLPVHVHQLAEALQVARLERLLALAARAP